jgi:hypothetical protein
VVKAVARAASQCNGLPRGQRRSLRPHPNSSVGLSGSHTSAHGSVYAPLGQRWDSTATGPYARLGGSARQDDAGGIVISSNAASWELGPGQVLRVGDNRSLWTALGLTIRTAIQPDRPHSRPGVMGIRAAHGE